MKKVYSFGTKLWASQQKRFFHTDDLLENLVPKIGGKHLYHSNNGGEDVYLLPNNCIGINTFAQSILIIESRLEENIEKCVSLIKQELDRDKDYYEQHTLVYRGTDYRGGYIF